MKRSTFGALALGVLAGVASAQPTITFLPLGYIVSDLSADGTVACGNLIGPYETFRWTEEEGPVLLGGATVPVLGVGAGSPDISYDGSKISATILGGDSIGPGGQYATMGVWENGFWSELSPPTGPGGSTCDSSIASCWGLSGDGLSVTGFYWASCGARPCTWQPGSPVVALQRTPGSSARVNGANFDGSVVVGWEEASFGNWQPTVWRNGVKSSIVTNDFFCAAEQVTADGSVIVGQSADAATRRAAIWTWNGAGYDEQLLPLLPGTAVGFGQAGALGISDDGSIVVGFNVFNQAPFSTGDGWIWTEETGLIEAEDYIASLGLTLPDNFDVSAFSGISADGSTIFGSGVDLTTFLDQSFIIRLDTGDCPGDLTTTGTAMGDPGFGEPDGSTNLSDLLYFVNIWNTDLGSPTPNPGSIADTTTTGTSAGDPAFGTPDGNVDLADLLYFVNEWTVGLGECP